MYFLHMFTKKFRFVKHFITFGAIKHLIDDTVR